MTYNRTTTTLQGPPRKNPEHLWTRYLAFEPIIPVTQFRKAQVRLSRYSRHWDKEAITDSLHRLLAQKGRLSQAVINDAKDAPSAETVANYFGSLHAAYAAVRYDPPARRPWGMNGKHWSKKAVLAGLQKLYAARGYVSNRLIDRFPDLPSHDYIRRHFGSISMAMRQAGLPVLSHNDALRRARKRRRAAGCDEYFLGVHWTDAKLLRALRQLEKQYGYMSVNLLDQNGSTPSAYYFVKRFGSLAEARALA